MDDANATRDGFRSSAVYSTEAWDCTRELRSLRDAVARGRADEATALRRNAEELERSALRRQHDESTALQQFLQGLHENFESKLERHRAHCGGRLDALERRLDGEVERLASLRCEVAAEARLAVREGFQKLDQYIENPNASGGEAFAQAMQRSLAKVSSEMQGAAVEEASRVAREIAQEIAQKIADEISQAASEAEKRSQEIARTVGYEAANEVASGVARDIAREVSGEVSHEVSEELLSRLDEEVERLRGEKADEANRHDEKMQALCERLEMMEDFSITHPAIEGDLKEHLSQLEYKVSTLASIEGMDDLSIRLGNAFAKKFDSLSERVSFCVEEVTSAQKVATDAERSAIHSIELAELSVQSAETSVASAEKLAESSAQEFFAKMQQQLDEVSSKLRYEMQAVEHELSGSMAPRSELHDVEQRRLELHDKTELLVEEVKRAELEKLPSIIEELSELTELREEMDELRADVDEVHDNLEAELQAEKNRSSALDGDLRKELQAMMHRHGEEQAKTLESLERSAESNHNVAMESLHELECSEGRAVQRLFEESRDLTEKMNGAGRNEVTNIGKQLREMRQELTTAASQWRTSASDTAQTLGALTANCQSLNSEFKEFQSQGLSHEWRIPKCMQRLEYLSMSEDSGVWLDSPSFSLGPLGQLELRLYPRGFRGGDGQCAIGLYAAGVEGLRAAPLQLDLAVEGLRRRATVLHEDNAGMLWLVQDLGRLEGHLVKTEDLTISVELLANSWASIDGSSGCSARPSPTPARASRSQVTPEAGHRDAVSREETSTNASSRPRPLSTGRISNNPFPKTSNVPTSAGAALFSHCSAVANSPSQVSEVSFGQDESARSARNSHVHPSGSPSGSPLDAPAVPRSSWTVFGEQQREAMPAVGVNSLAAFDSNSSSRSVSTGAVSRRPPASPMAMPPWGATADRRTSTSTNPFDK